ncbi:MAG: alpha/beta hydrolase [Dactylosporangium sp.]|nr:alpha/beta hydrolase [Dactylosporangium sp.]NNJ61733.1 alpha/beta hydrolase [Dactylosporangium sp.]
MMDFRWPPPPDGRPERCRAPAARGPQAGRPTLPEPATELVATPHGIDLERLVTGEHPPTTVFAHGLGCSIAGIRPLGSGVVGRRVFFHFRGHGRSGAPAGGWTYTDLARDLRAIADLSGATRAVAAGLGAGALCHLLRDHPTRFDRVVLFLPAACDQPAPPAVRVRLNALLEAVGSGETSTVAELISQDVPVRLRQSAKVWEYLRRRLEHLMREGLAAGLEDLAGLAPVPDLAGLRNVTTPVLVLACRDDDLHPVSVAERLCAALPAADLHVYDRPGAFWADRIDLRDRIGAFLNVV